MLITSHIAATTGLLLTTNLVGIKTPPEVIAASYFLGVGIDIDHLVAHLKDCLAEIASFAKGTVHKKYGTKYLHTYLQEPTSFILALIISYFLYIRLNTPGVFIPSLALGLHIFMDSFVDYDNLLFWPISKKAYRGFIKPNTLGELLLGIIVTPLLFYFWQLIK